MRILLATLLIGALAACASTQSPESENEDTEVLLMSVVTERCNIPELETYFSFDSAELDGHKNLDKLAECLVSGPLRDHDVLLIGHTDPLGPEDYNRRLGLDRAMRVGEFLMRSGVAENRIRYETRGKSNASKDPQKYSRDRRVDINILL